MAIRRALTLALNASSCGRPVFLYQQNAQCKQFVNLIRRNSSGSWLVQKLRGGNTESKPLTKTAKQLREEKHMQIFEHYLEKPNEEQFHAIIDNYVKGDKQKRGHVHFVNTALQYMEKYNAEKNLISYKKLLDIFPRDMYNNKSPLDVLWPKPYPQIYCALDILTEMEINGLCPDLETRDLVFEIFGQKSDPLEKLTRLKVWFEFSKTLNPYSLSDKTYANPFLLSKSALSRMAGCADDDITVIKGNSEDQDDFSICVDGDLQTDIISIISSSATLQLDGPIPIWMYRTQCQYFMLKIPSTEVHKALTRQCNNDEESDVLKPDDIVVGMFMCNRPSSAALNNWVNILISKNLKLKDFSIIMSNELVDYLQSLVENVDSIDKK